MSNICKIVEDLLPLYIENLTNEENTSMIENHLNECESCKEIYNEMKGEINSSISKKDKTVEENTKVIIGIISKYQSVLKFALSFFIMLFGTLIISAGVPFLNSFPLLIIAPIICTFIYRNNIGLLVISFIVAIIGGYIVVGAWDQIIFVSLGQFLLMVFSIVSGVLIRSIIDIRKDNKKRVALGIAAFIVVTFLLFINNGFCGNPVSYIITQSKVSKYIKEVYPDKDMKIKKVSRNWKDGSYNVLVAEGQDVFNINVYSTGYISDAYKINRADSYYNSYSNMIKLILESNIENQYFWVVSTADESEYGIEAIEKLEETSLIIRFAETNERYPNLTSFSKEEFFNMCTTVVNTLNESDIKYKTINFQSENNVNGEFYLMVSDEVKFEDIEEY